MNRKTICAVVLAISGCVMAVFAAKVVDPCTEKYESCSDSCTNAFASCKARGANPDECEKAQKKCMQACDKAKKDCEGKAKK